MVARCGAASFCLRVASCRSSLSTFASRSLSITRNSSPAFGRPEKPSTRTGVEGGASLICCPLSSISDFTLPLKFPQMNGLAHLERAGAHDDGRGRPAARLDLRLDDRPARSRRGAGFQFEHFGLQQNHLQQVIHPRPFQGRDGADDGIAAPIFRREPLLLKLPLHLVEIHVRQIDLVQRHDDGDLGRPGVIQRLDGLRHGAVIRRHDQHHDIRDIRAARPHGRERGMARGIEEGDFLPLVLHAVGADVLGDPAGLARPPPANSARNP